MTIFEAGEDALYDGTIPYDKGVTDMRDYYDETPAELRCINCIHADDYKYCSRCTHKIKKEAAKKIDKIKKRI